MSLDKIDKLYKNYEILTAAKEKSEVSGIVVFVVISINWLYAVNLKHLFGGEASKEVVGVA